MPVHAIKDVRVGAWYNRTEAQPGLQTTLTIALATCGDQCHYFMMFRSLHDVST